MKKDTLLVLVLFCALLTRTELMVFKPSSYQIKLGFYKKQFESWTIKLNKIYPSPQQRYYRMNVFIQNYQKIEQHNDRYMNGQTQHTLKVNQFADLTLNQFIQFYGGYKHSNKTNQLQITQECKGIIQNAPNPPQQVDWIPRAVNTPEDQGACGSNWAFTSTGAVQGLYAIRKSKKIRFSQQQLIDCSAHYGSEGCRGGFMDQGFWYIIDNGITSDQLYPYDGVKNDKCIFTSSMRLAQIRSCARIPYGSYQKLLSAIVQQPTSVAIDASHFDFQFYQKGIYDGNCTDDINRGMLLVGYGNDNGTQFWNLRNSFGTGWGDEGYIRIKKTNSDGPGKCGIQVAASVPQILM